MVRLLIRKVFRDGMVKRERIQVICPACGQKVEAVASDGRVRGYCVVAKRHVDFLIETEHRNADITPVPSGGAI